jgi:hypothetical protein
MGDVCDPDDDNDGIEDDADVCPLEDATGFDADGDGCIDTLGGIADNIETLASEGVIDEQVENSLVSKVNNAGNSATKDNICAAVNQLEAFKNQVNAQRGNKISDEAADLMLEYADNIIMQLLSALPSEESC